MKRKTSLLSKPLLMSAMLVVLGLSAPAFAQTAEQQKAQLEAKAATDAAVDASANAEMAQDAAADAQDASDTAPMSDIAAMASDMANESATDASNAASTAAGAAATANMASDEAATGNTQTKSSAQTAKRAAATAASASQAASDSAINAAATAGVAQAAASHEHAMEDMPSQPAPVPTTAAQVTVNSVTRDPIHDHFVAADVNADTAIDKTEAGVDAGLTTQFDKFDKDGDGRLSQAEYKQWRDWK